MMQAVRYPDVPGAKRSGTSSDAALAMRERAPTLKAQVLDVLRTGDFTADEVADKLGVSLLAIRPRVSELRAQDKIHDTGRVRENLSGVMAKVWAFGPLPRNVFSTITTNNI